MNTHKPVVVIVAAAFTAAACLELEHKHIEPRMWQPEPQLTGDVLIATATAVFSPLKHWIQFT
jgi:hypothetical protein